MPRLRRLACFVTPHGFGHAARTAAILGALRRQRPRLEVEIWTSVPPWFFEEALGFPFDLVNFASDVGMIQKSPTQEDLPATLAALERFWSPAVARARSAEVARALAASGVDLVLCDLAPAALEAAREAGIPSVLVENFTWDWIFEPLVELEGGFAPWIPFLRDRFDLADLRLQLEPACAPRADAIPIPPVARPPSGSRDRVRRRLRVADGQALVLLSLGGVEYRHENLASLSGAETAVFALPGASDTEVARGNLRLLPHRSPVYHPDLVAAADVVVGKLGYSTVTEILAAGGRMIFVPRPGFRESAVLERYAGERIPLAPISAQELESGSWVERLGPLLARPAAAPRPADGAAVAAREILGWCDR